MVDGDRVFYNMVHNWPEEGVFEEEDWHLTYVIDVLGMMDIYERLGFSISYMNAPDDTMLFVLHKASAGWRVIQTVDVPTRKG